MYFYILDETGDVNNTLYIGMIIVWNYYLQPD